MYDDYDDYRNARSRDHGSVRVHSSGPAPWGAFGPSGYGYGGPRHTGGAMVPWRPQYPAAPMPMAPPGYAPGYSYYEERPVPRRGLLDGLDKGQALEGILGLIAALRTLPDAPPATGDVARDVANLGIQQQNTAQFMRSTLLFMNVGKLVNAVIAD